MARKELSVEPREVTGKKVAQLRRAGIIPGNIYGHNVASVSVQMPALDLVRTLRAAGVNEVIDVRISGERSARPVVIHHVQRDPITRGILHADLYQVALHEKMRADVPLVLTGTSGAVSAHQGTLLQPSEALHIEALPLDIPSHIEVDVSVLTELDMSIHVRDLNVPANVTVLTDPDVVVARVESPRVAEVVEAEAAPAAAGAEALEEAEKSAATSET